MYKKKVYESMMPDNFKYIKQFKRIHPNIDYKNYWNNKKKKLDTFFINCIITNTATVINIPIILLSSHPDIRPAVFIPQNHSNYTQCLIVSVLYHSHRFLPLKLQIQPNKQNMNGNKMKRNRKRKRNSLGEYVTGSQWFEQRKLYCPKTFEQIYYLKYTTELLYKQEFMSTYSLFNNKDILQIIIYSLEKKFNHKIRMFVM